MTSCYFTVTKGTKGIRFSHGLKVCILPSPKKGDLSQTNNYRGISLTPIAANVYNGMLLNRIQPEMEKLLRKNQNGFRKSYLTVSQIVTVRRIIKGIKAKQLPATLLFVDFLKAFDSVHREKMKRIIVIWYPGGNCLSHNDPIQEYQSHGALSRRRH